MHCKLLLLPPVEQFKRGHWFKFSCFALYIAKLTPAEILSIAVSLISLSVLVLSVGKLLFFWASSITLCTNCCFKIHLALFNNISDLATCSIHFWQWYVSFFQKNYLMSWTWKLWLPKTSIIFCWCSFRMQCWYLHLKFTENCILELQPFTIHKVKPFYISCRHNFYKTTP